MLRPLLTSAFFLVLASTASLLACDSDEKAPSTQTEPSKAGCERPPEALPALDLHTARWAFEPWISKDISNRDDTYSFVDGFKSRGIPVGAVVLDSPWETHYNTFVPMPTRYPDFPGMVRELHAQDVRVVAWVTQMVNDTSFDVEVGGDVYPGVSPNFEEGLRCDYYANDGETFVWWKGRGAAVDFFNPHARAWWHQQQDLVLDAGLDGWKLDFGESYIRLPTLSTFAGEVTHQAYSEKYYEDFLAYGRAKRGKDFLTMVRAWDASYDIPGRFYAKREHTPVGWMGDNRRDFIGLVDALDHMFISAAANYPVVGSDLGGYLDRDDLNLLGPQIPFDAVNFQRWTAQSAMTPFMQLHGRANLEPWAVPEQADAVVATYRYWATLHHALVPFFYALAEDAWKENAPPVLRPVGDAASWPGDYRYHLGEAFLVAPILDGTGIRNVTFPAGASYRELDGTVVHAGGSTIAVDLSADASKLPVYVREGAIIPMTVDSDVIAMGGPEAIGARTLLVYPGAAPATFRMREDDDAVTAVTAQKAAGGITVTLARAVQAVVVRVLTDKEPAGVTVDGQALTRAASAGAIIAGEGYAWDDAAKVAIVKVAPRAGQVSIALAPPI